MLIGLCCSGSVFGEVLYEVAKLSPSDPVSGDQFGFAVSASSDVAIVGKPFGSADEGAGSAYVFRRVSGSPGTWAEDSAGDPEGINHW